MHGNGIYQFQPFGFAGGDRASWQWEPAWSRRRPAAMRPVARKEESERSCYSYRLSGGDFDFSTPGGFSRYSFWDQKMIQLTRLNHIPLVLNSDLIEHIEVTPDTVIMLTTGQIIRVLESADEVVARVVEFRRSIYRDLFRCPSAPGSPQESAPPIRPAVSESHGRRTKTETAGAKRRQEETGRPASRIWPHSRDCCWPLAAFWAACCSRAARSRISPR